MAENVVLHGVVLTAGKNQSVPLKAIDNGDGTFSLDITAMVQMSDLQIGAVEIKNATTDDRQVVDTEGVAKVSLPNRPGFVVRELDTGTINNEKLGPSFAVPDGHAVFIEADAANVDVVRIGGVGETAVATTRREVSPGDPFPVALKVSNLNQIAAQSPTADQIVRLIVEAVS